MGRFSGCAYGVYLGFYSTQGVHHSEYTPDDPPTNVIIGEDDTIASPSAMCRRVEKLQALGIDAEFHLLPHLRHGFGLGRGTTADGWHEDAVRFWEKYIFRKNGISYRK